jgi:hypothetical protein
MFDTVANSSLCAAEAELLGAFIGDGWIQSNLKALYICGHPSKDQEYYDTRIAPLFSAHFADVRPRLFPYWGVYGVGCYNRLAIRRAVGLGFQTGKKSLCAEIPLSLLSEYDAPIHHAILRGLFDTDGCFWCEKSNAKTSTIWKRTHRYIPRIGISSCSHMLLLQCQKILYDSDIPCVVRHKNREGHYCNRKVHDSFLLLIEKRVNVILFFDTIKPRNPRHLIRFEQWKQIGYL